MPSPPSSHRPHRPPRRGERGAVGSVQMIVLMPLLIGLFLAAMQAALYYYGRSAAISIAQTGAAAAAAEHGTTADCQAAAATLQAAIGDAITDVHVSCQRTATRATTIVTGQALSVFPGWQNPVSQRAAAPVERPT